MASTQQKQAEAKARKKAEALTQKLVQAARPNTTTWVDDSYGEALGRLLIKTVDGERSTKSKGLRHLEQVRKMTGYMGEESSIQGTKVWFLDTSKSSPGCGFISPLFYDADGHWDNALAAKEGITITPHALGRCYQRLRTNSSTDIKALLLKLVGLADAADYLGEEVEVTVPGGTFYLVQDNLPVSWHKTIKNIRAFCEKAMIEKGESLDDPDVQEAIEILIDEQEVPIKVTVAGTNQTREGKVTLKQARALKIGNPQWVVKTFIATKP